MNLAALEAALPAFTVSAITEVTASTQVYVNDRARVPGASVEVAWEFLGQEIERDAGGLGLPQVRAHYRAVYMAAAATLAARKVFAKELTSALHGKRGPTGLSDLDHCEVGEVLIEGSGLDTGAGQTSVDVVFVGDMTTGDAGA